MRIWFALGVLIRCITGEPLTRDNTSGWSRLARIVRDAYEAWSSSHQGVMPRPVMVLTVNVAEWLLGGNSSKAVSLEFRLDRMGRYSEAGYPTMGEVLGLRGEWYLLEFRYDLRGLKNDDLWRAKAFHGKEVVLSWGRHRKAGKENALYWTKITLPEATFRKGFSAKTRPDGSVSGYRANKAGLSWAVCEEILPETMQLTLPDRNGRDRLFQIIGSGSSLVQGRKCVVVEVGSPLQRHIAGTVPKLGDRISYLQQLVSAQLRNPFSVPEGEIYVVPEDQARAWFGPNCPDDMAWDLTRDARYCGGLTVQIRGAINFIGAVGTAMVKGTLTMPSPAVMAALRKEDITASIVLVAGCLKAGRGLEDPHRRLSCTPLGTMVIGITDDFVWCGKHARGSRLPALALQWVLMALESRSNNAGAKALYANILRSMGPRVLRQSRKAIETEKVIEAWLAGDATDFEVQKSVLLAMGAFRESVTVDHFGKRSTALTQGARETLDTAAVLVATDARFITCAFVLAAIRQFTATRLRAIVRSGGYRGTSLVQSWAPEVEAYDQKPLVHPPMMDRPLDREFTVMVNPSTGLKADDLLMAVRNPARSLEGLTVARVALSTQVPEGTAWVPALMASAMDGDRDGDTLALYEAPELVDALCWLKGTAALEARYPFEKAEQDALGLELSAYVDGKISDPVTPENLRALLAQYLGEGSDRIGVYTNALATCLDRQDWTGAMVYSLAVEVDSKLKKLRVFDPNLIEQAFGLASGPNWLRALKGKKSLSVSFETEHGERTRRIEFGDKLFENGCMDAHVARMPEDSFHDPSGLEEEKGLDINRETLDFTQNPVAALTLAVLRRTSAERLRSDVQCSCHEYFMTEDSWNVSKTGVRSAKHSEKVFEALDAAWFAAVDDIDPDDSEVFRRSLWRGLVTKNVKFGSRLYSSQEMLPKPGVFPLAWRWYNGTRPCGEGLRRIDSARFTDATGMIRIATEYAGYSTLPTWEEVAKKFDIEVNDIDVEEE